MKETFLPSKNPISERTRRFLVEGSGPVRYEPMLRPGTGREFQVSDTPFQEVPEIDAAIFPVEGFSHKEWAALRQCPHLAEQLNQVARVIRTEFGEVACKLSREGSDDLGHFVARIPFAGEPLDALHLIDRIRQSRHSSTAQDRWNVQVEVEFV